MIQRFRFLYALCLMAVMSACSGSGTPVAPTLPPTPRRAAVAPTSNTYVTEHHTRPREG